MGHPHFDRDRLLLHPLKERENRVRIESDHVTVDSEPRDLSDSARTSVVETAMRLRAARDAGKSRMLAFGAHAIKNGLGPVLIKLMEDGWLTHLATNGAGIIHDWEIAYLGETSEHVEENLKKGQFGLWDETGKYINLAITVGAYNELGYGESVGNMILNEGLDIPSEEALTATVNECLAESPGDAASAADLLATIKKFNIPAGRMAIPHKCREYSVQAAASRLAVPFTGHPMFGHDIIYTHPMNNGAAIGRAAQRDFLRFVDGVYGLDGGVYMSIGSAVMSPMIFEKALSMCQNLRIQEGAPITDHFISVVDLAAASDDWSGEGEPTESSPDYYLRFNKTFRRMGGTMRYASADNRDFLLWLYRELNQ